MQVFAFTDNPEFQALLELEVKEITGQRPIVRNTISELKSLLAIFQSIELLIVELPEDFSAVAELKAFLSSSRGRFKRILTLGDDEKSDAVTRSFTRIEISELFEEIKSIINPVTEVKSGWSAVPLCTLIHFESVPFDLYIKLSDQRYVKRIPAFEKMDKDVLESFRFRNISELYCERKHNRDFSMMLINNMINKIERSYPSFHDQIKANEEVFETTKTIIHHLGIPGRVIEVCDAAIEKMCSDVLVEPDIFSSYLLSLRGDKKLNFQYKLITLTNYIGTQLIQEMSLPKMDEQIRKLVFASFFCDITLKNPGLHYHRKTEDADALSAEEQNEVNFHALKASELVAEYRNAPREVSIIIRQHHGSFSGIGFPLEKSNQLLPLSKILVVSQELAFSILTHEETPAMEILRSFLKKNRCHGLQELINHLEGSFSKAA